MTYFTAVLLLYGRKQQPPEYGWHASLGIGDLASMGTVGNPLRDCRITYSTSPTMGKLHEVAVTLLYPLEQLPLSFIVFEGSKIVGLLVPNLHLDP